MAKKMKKAKNEVGIRELIIELCSNLNRSRGLYFTKETENALLELFVIIMEAGERHEHLGLNITTNQLAGLTKLTGNVELLSKITKKKGAVAFWAMFKNLLNIFKSPLPEEWLHVIEKGWKIREHTCAKCGCKLAFFDIDNILMGCISCFDFEK